METEFSNLIEILLSPQPDIPDANKCPFCSHPTDYKTTAGLHNHIETKHPGAVLPTTEHPDFSVLYGHTRELLKMLIVKRMLDNSIRYGDGTSLALIIKYMLLFFRQLGCTKYAIAAFEFVAQQQIFLSEKMKTLVRQDRFVNNAGRRNSCLPVDLDVEHSNKDFKMHFRISNGEISQKVLDRISKAQDIVQEVLETYSESFGLKHFDKRHQVDDVKYLADVQKLSDILRKVDVFNEGNASNLFSKQLQQASHDILASTDMGKFRVWILHRLSVMKDLRFYKY